MLERGRGRGGEAQVVRGREGEGGECTRVTDRRGGSRVDGSTLYWKRGWEEEEEEEKEEEKEGEMGRKREGGKNKVEGEEGKEKREK